ncbi:MAG: hypothetical protein KH586_08715 [Tannerella sp.]|nr:hypothetical protein [Tannerella sp.]
MIQVSDFIAMFAVFKTKNTKQNISIGSIFYVVQEACILQKYRAVQIPAAVIDICQCSWSNLEGEQPFLHLYLNFSLAMTKNNENASMVNNSTRTATSAHETCTSLTSFQTLETLIPQLHEARIRFRKNRVTGVFNITGRYTTMSALTIEQLIDNVLEKQREYRDYISENRKRKATQAPCI